MKASYSKNPFLVISRINASLLLHIFKICLFSVCPSWWFIFIENYYVGTSGFLLAHCPSSLLRWTLNGLVELLFSLCILLTLYMRDYFSVCLTSARLISRGSLSASMWNISIDNVLKALVSSMCMLLSFFSITVL